MDYPRPVPWNLTADAAKKLIASAQKPACVVTGGSPEKIMGLAQITGASYLQLHCGESLQDTALIVRELGRYGVRVIKTLFPNTPDIERAAADFCALGVYALLLDPRTPDNAAQGGQADLSLYRKISLGVTCPVVLAGGITPDNAAETVRASGAGFLDIMSGLESRPGVKDERKVAALFQALGRRPAVE